MSDKCDDWDFRPRPLFVTAAEREEYEREQKQRDAAEAMRAKCEAIARAYDLGTVEGWHIANAIAALKAQP